jgi:hypothetical protein
VAGVARAPVPPCDPRPNKVGVDAMLIFIIFAALALSVGRCASPVSTAWSRAQPGPGDWSEVDVGLAPYREESPTYAGPVTTSVSCSSNRPISPGQRPQPGYQLRGPRRPREVARCTDSPAALDHFDRVFSRPSKSKARRRQDFPRANVTAHVLKPFAWDYVPDLSTVKKRGGAEQSPPAGHDTKGH